MLEKPPATPPSVRRRTARSDEELVAMHQEYEKCGTLGEVGVKQGLTKERVRQLLRIGSRKGLFVYPPPKPARPQATTLEALIESGKTCKEIRAATGLSIKDFSEISIDGRRIDEIVETKRQERAKRAIIDRYIEMSTRLGRSPSTTDLQRDRSEGRRIYARIIRAWSSFAEFRRKALGEHADTMPYGHRWSQKTWPERFSPWPARERAVLKFLAARNGTASKSIMLHELAKTGQREQIWDEAIKRAVRSGAIESIGGRSERRYRARQKPTDMRHGEAVSRYRIKAYHPEHSIVVGTQRAAMEIPGLTSRDDIDGIFVTVAAGEDEEGEEIILADASGLKTVEAAKIMLQGYGRMPRRVEERLSSELTALERFRASGLALGGAEDEFEPSTRLDEDFTKETT